MRDQEINITIAEACGWTEIDGLSAKGLMGKPPGKLCSFDYLPDYCNDLNAMHEAEKVLEEKGLVGKYELALGRNGGNRFNWSKIHSTAKQRAEAFLRTLGKWKEDAK